MPCFVELSFGDGSSFKNAGFGTVLQERYWKIRKPLKRQKPNDSATAALTKAAKAMKAVLEVLAGAGPIFNFLFGFAMSNIQSMVEGMQISVHFPMF
jgi:hypothetical protein